MDTELTTKVCCGASAVCASHFGHESDDDGFGDYVGADHDRVMRDRDRSRVESTLEKMGYVEGLTQGREEALQEGFDSGMKLGSKVGMAFGHLLAQLEFYHSIGGMSQHLQSALHSRFPGLKSDSFAGRLEKVLKELKEADKTWRAEESNFDAWRAEYLRLLEEAKVLFASSQLPLPQLAPGF